MALLLLLLLLLALTALLAVLLAAALTIRGASRFSRTRKDFPTPAGHLPVLGHALQYSGDEVHVFKLIGKYCRTTGRRWVIKVMDQVAVNVADAQAAEAILTSGKHITKGPLYDFLVPWLGRGLLTNTGASWHHRRKLLTPAFHFKILDEFGPMIAQYASRLVAQLHEARLTAKGYVDVVNPISNSTLSTICETAMGVDLKLCAEEDMYFNAVRIVSQSLAYRLVRPWLWRDFIFNLTSYGQETKRQLQILHGFTYKVIQERKVYLEELGKDVLNGGGKSLRKRRLAFLDMLLAAQKEDASLTDTHIREEVDTFMFEGHETTAMGICWTLFALGNHLDIQQRVREEVVAAGEDWQKVNALPYLEMVIKESLRLYPPVYYIGRDSDQKLPMGDSEVPPGVYLDLHIFHVHRDPAVFPEPSRFNPERFSSEQEQGRHPFAYIPFSGGLRNCIGRRFAMMELKLMVAAVLRAFSIRSQHTDDQIVFHPELVLRSKHGIMLQLDPLPLPSE